MAVKSLTAIAVLDREPTKTEAAELAEALVNSERPDVWTDNGLEISWFCSEELPPRESTQLLLHEYDQLEAGKRTAGQSGVYLVVTAERNTI